LAAAGNQDLEIAAEVGIGQSAGSDSQDSSAEAGQRNPMEHTAMGETVGLSEKSVRRIWHKHGMPRLFRTFKFSHDPEFAEKLEVIVGLYLNPPEPAIVLCADERARSSTKPGLPIKKGCCGTMTYD
jgi:hypothetical protein